MDPNDILVLLGSAGGALVLAAGGGWAWVRSRRGKRGDTPEDRTRESGGTTTAVKRPPAPRTGKDGQARTVIEGDTRPAAPTWADTLSPARTTSAAPAAPAAPAEPAAPVEPAAPAESTEPAAPVEPVTSAEPVETSVPTEPSVPSEPSAPSAPSVPVDETAETSSLEEPVADEREAAERTAVEPDAEERAPEVPTSTFMPADEPSPHPQDEAHPDAATAHGEDTASVEDGETVANAEPAADAQPAAEVAPQAGITDAEVVAEPQPVEPVEPIAEAPAESVVEPAPPAEPAAAQPAEPASAPAESAAATPAEPASAPADLRAVEKPEPADDRLLRLRDRLAKSGSLGRGLLTLLTSGTVDENTWDEIEETLLIADLGPEATDELMDALRTRMKVLGTQDHGAIKEALREELVRIVNPDLDRRIAATRIENEDGTSVPSVVLMVGVNGTGKTTTVGKLARVLVAADRSVVLGAADTFRAAAAEQLATWGERVGVETVRSHKDGADPASVAFDAVKKGVDEDVDVVIVDTAGRLQNKQGLMDQLGKVKRVAEKPLGGASVAEVLLVLDATTGQNGMQQARVFADAVNITGLVLTKLDGTAKGGIVVNVQRELGVPVKMVGLGEGMDDLAPFDPYGFVDALLGD